MTRENLDKLCKANGLTNMREQSKTVRSEFYQKYLDLPVSCAGLWQRTVNGITQIVALNLITGEVTLGTWGPMSSGLYYIPLNVVKYSREQFNSLAAWLKKEAASYC